MRSCPPRRSRRPSSSRCRSDIPLTVTASPAKGLDATLELTEKLVGHGYSVVPHLAARMITGRSELSEIVDRLKALGIDNVFVPAGDQDPPAGEYAGSLGLLEDLTEMGRPFTHVGITGYPESHPVDRGRHHDPVDVGQAFPRDLRRQQPLLRRRHDQRVAASDAQTRDHLARLASGCPVPSSAPSCCRWRPRSASGSR